MHKICNICSLEKDIELFYKKVTKDGYSNECKKCTKIIRKNYYLKNKEVIKKQKTIYRNNNSAKIADYYKQNPEKTKLKQQRFKQLNPDYFRKYELERRHKDIDFKILKRTRTRIYSALKGYRKSRTTLELLGCSIDELKSHLKSKFYKNPKTSENMSWGNYGQYGWHIDHIIPLTYFDLKDPEQLKKACHYTNLQPLWWFENISKHDNLL